MMTESGPGFQTPLRFIAMKRLDPVLKRMLTTLPVLFWAFLAGCLPQTDVPAQLAPPVAAVHSHVVDIQGRKRSDPYFWMRDDSRTDPAVLGYLNAENAYLDAALAHTRPLQAQLLAEMSARIDPEHEDVPWRDGRYWYAERYRTGQEYPIITRRPTPHGPETVILDANERARPGEFYTIGAWAVSEDGNFLAFTEDRTGREQHDLRIRDLRSGDLLPDSLGDLSAQIAWANDNKSLYYVRLDTALRPIQVWRHELGTNINADVLVYEERDTTFDMSLEKSRDGNFVLIRLVSTLSTEIRLIDANAVATTSRPFLPREPEHRYFVETDGDEAYILSNWHAPNYRLLRTTLTDATDKSRWQEVLPQRDDVPLYGMHLMRDFIVINEIHAGTLKFRVLGRDGGSDYYIEGSEAAYAATFGENPDLDTNTLRYYYTSLVTPYRVHDYELSTREDRILKQEFAGADFDPGNLRTEQITITAQDGTRVPVTLLYTAGSKPDGGNGLFLHGYGAYGDVFYPEFNRDILSLVQRGFVYAIAHIRGGGEFGQAWYDGGRVFNKKNTFTDFLDVAQGLVQQGWAAPDRVVGFGRSAGGLLIGAVANAQPNPFSILITEVPFVDVITTMADDTIPLTSFEWQEWGDPRITAQYDYMLSYSPYDQVAAQKYSHLLVTTGLWDARVQYWEPAKWVARLRALKTGDSKLYFATDMTAGHAGLAGRYQRLRETAMEYAFILDTLAHSQSR